MLIFLRDILSANKNDKVNRTFVLTIKVIIIFKASSVIT